MSNVTQWSTILRSCPTRNSPIVIGLEGEDAQDLASFQRKVMAALDEHLATRSVQDTTFRRMLSGVESKNERTERGDPWLARAIVFQDQGIPFPGWIQERERELIALGPKAPSRLVGVTGL